MGLSTPSVCDMRLGGLRELPWTCAAAPHPCHRAGMDTTTTPRISSILEAAVVPVVNEEADADS